MFKKIQLWFASLFKKTEVVVVKPKKKKKKKYVSYHAQKRFQERHGVVFTNELAKNIVEDIIAKKAHFIKPQPGNTELWIVEYNGKKYRIIFSLKNKTIVTVYSGLKNKRRKPKRKKKFRADNGKRGKSAESGPRPVAYKRKSKPRRYEEVTW